MYTALPLLSSAGEVTGAVVTFLDVTLQRALDVALRHSEARLRSMLESVPGYALLLDAELKIVFFNRLLPGVEPAQALGQSAVMFARENARAAFTKQLRQVLDAGIPQTFEVEADAWIGGGTYRISVGAVRDAHTVSGLTLIAEDITDQKVMEARLLLSERLAAIGTLAAGVAHEINNPLTYVLGNLELLQKELQGNPELLTRTEEAIEGADRISSVVLDLMSFSHRDDQRLGAVDVADAVDRTVRIAHHELSRRARFVRGPIAVPDVRGSAARIGQVLLNILLNAAHSIPAGAPESNEIRLAASVTPDQRVRISISDTGRGIERSLLGRIFDPFITTKPFGEGTGLGLYVCHNIVTSLGGAIWVDSQVGKGSTFHVDLPIYKPAGESASPAPPRPSREPKRQLRLLVVDDEPSIAAFIRHALAPHQVATVSSGEEAIVALDSRTFDGVLCDVVMSGVTGVQIFEHVKAKHPELSRHFLFITGAALRDLAPELSRYDVPVLYKPFSLRELLAAVNQLVEK